MRPYRWYLIGVVAGLVILCHGPQSYAEIQHTTQVIWIYEQGADRKVAVDVPTGGAIEYVNDENCGEAEHRTEHGGKFYHHLHVTYSLPRVGVDLGDFSIRTVTNAKIDAYWNRDIAGRYGFPYYTQLGPSDHKRNCAAHALSVGPWVQSDGAERILQYDWRPTGDQREEGNVWVAEGVFHMGRVQTLCPPNYFWPPGTFKETTEKNGTSAIYIGTWDCPGLIADADTVYEERP